MEDFALVQIPKAAQSGFFHIADHAQADAWRSKYGPRGEPAMIAMN
jgi:hypothetical protein